MINKELLSKVLDNEVPYQVKVHKIIIKNNSLNYFYNSKDSGGGLFEANEYINIYELAHKCKEWIVSKGLSYAIYYDDSFKNYKCTVLQENCNDGFYSIGDTFVSSTEIEAVFSACRYILNNKNIK